MEWAWPNRTLALKCERRGTKNQSDTYSDENGSEQILHLPYSNPLFFIGLSGVDNTWKQI